MAALGSRLKIDTRRHGGTEKGAGLNSGN